MNYGRIPSIRPERGNEAPNSKAPFKTGVS